MTEKSEFQISKQFLELGSEDNEMKVAEKVKQNRNDNDRPSNTMMIGAFPMINGQMPLYFYNTMKEPQNKGKKFAQTTLMSTNEKEIISTKEESKLGASVVIKPDTQRMSSIDEFTPSTKQNAPQTQNSIQNSSNMWSKKVDAIQFNSQMLIAAEQESPLHKISQFSHFRGSQGGRMASIESDVDKLVNGKIEKIVANQRLKYVEKNVKFVDQLIEEMKHMKSSKTGPKISSPIHGSNKMHVGKTFSSFKPQTADLGPQSGQKSLSKFYSTTELNQYDLFQNNQLNCQKIDELQPIFPIKATQLLRARNIKTASQLAQREIIFPQPYLDDIDIKSQTKALYDKQRMYTENINFNDEQRDLINEFEDYDAGMTQKEIDNQFDSLDQSSMSRLPFRRNKSAANISKVIINSMHMSGIKTPGGHSKSIHKDEPFKLVVHKFKQPSFYTGRIKNGLYDEISDNVQQVIQFIQKDIERDEELLHLVELFTKCPRNDFSHQMETYFRLCVSRETNDPKYDDDYKQLDLKQDYIQRVYRFIENRLRWMGFLEDKIINFKQSFEFYSIKFELGRKMLLEIGGIENLFKIINFVISGVIEEIPQFQNIGSHHDVAKDAFCALLNCDYHSLQELANQLKNNMISSSTQEQFFIVKKIIWKAIEHNESIEKEVKLEIMAKFQWTRSIIFHDYSHYMAVIKNQLVERASQNTVIILFYGQHNNDIVEQIFDSITRSFFLYGGNYQNVATLLKEKAIIPLNEKLFFALEQILHDHLKFDSPPQLFREELFIKLQKLQYFMKIGFDCNSCLINKEKQFVQLIGEWVHGKLVKAPFRPPVTDQKALNLEFLQLFFDLFFKYQNLFTAVDAKCALNYFNIENELLRLWFFGIQQTIPRFLEINRIQKNDLLSHIEQGLLIFREQGHSR